MNQGLILIPALALAAWTMTILLLIPYRRFKSYYKEEVSAHDFELGESDKVPTYVALANRNYMNLLELPTLFYIACILFYVINAVSIAVISLAWLYVGLRITHSLVHIGYNRVTHRLIVFALSNIVLALMWFTLAFSVLREAQLIV